MLKHTSNPASSRALFDVADAAADTALADRGGH